MPTELSRRLASPPWALLLVLLPWPAHAAPPSRWVLDHLLVDVGAQVGWRAGWVDPQHDGFSALGAGGEVNMGLEFGGGYGVVAGARAMYGTSSGQDAGVSSLPYLEASAQLGGQLRLSDLVRIGAGVSMGRIWRGTPPGPAGPEPVPPAGVSLLAGGFLRCGVDWLPRSTATLLRALSLWLRLDLSGHPPDRGALPRSTMALSLSLGLRL
ncbi:MAG: hypothetical protein RMK29_07820 [Myxococcales bacterium]|nr:hypothetical protein [Myxococcota bacterium]MDW8281601.1 hypothetical protein [Myxococcales bacterium]